MSLALVSIKEFVIFYTDLTRNLFTLLRRVLTYYYVSII